MALIGVNPTGNKWPGTLEVSRIDAYAGAFKLDPSLPVLGTDPKYFSQKVVIGRGRLVGLKADASVSSTTITTTIAHQSILTLSDGITVAPLGYATSNMMKDWDSKTNGDMNAINRNQAIAVPYLASINGLYGSLRQGDKVTALSSTDPRKVGAITKYIPYHVGYVNGIPGASLSLSGSLQINNTVETAFKPVLLAAYTVAGAFISGAAGAGSGSTSVVYTSGIGWAVSGSLITSAIVGYGQGPEMIAGEVMEMEGIADMPGYLKWVTSNFGEWSLGEGLVYPLVGNSTLTSTASAYYLSTGVVCLEVDSANALSPVKMDASKPITITTTSAASAYLFNADTGAWDDKGVTYTLPPANFVGADETQGACYMVDPINGVIRLFGIGTTSAGAAYTGAAGALSPIRVTYYKMPMQEQPEYSPGVYGLTNPDFTSAPYEWTLDPVTGTASVGIMKVAIH
jgi:hypothetical protein